MTSFTTAQGLFTQENFLNLTTTQNGSTSGEGFPQEVRTIWSWILTVSLFVVAVVTFLGNGMVMITFFLERRLIKSNFNLFLLNLTFTDIAVSMTAIPFYGVHFFYGKWPFGVYLCNFWIFCDWGMTFASVYTLVAISVDRYWAVCWSHHYRAHNTPRRTILVVVAVWVLVLILWLPPYINDRVLAANSTDSHGCEWSVNYHNNYSFAIFMAVAGYHLPSVIIIYCYIRVFLVMKKSRRGVSKRTLALSATANSDIPMRSNLTVNSYRSTESDIGSDFKEPDGVRYVANPCPPSSDSNISADFRETEKQCDVKIIVENADGQSDGELSPTLRERSSSYTEGIPSGNRTNLLRVPIEVEPEPENIGESKLSLDFPKVSIIRSVIDREKRRPCSFTEGTRPVRVFTKKSPDGIACRRNRTSGDLRASRAKHISAISQATYTSRGTTKSSTESKEYKLFVRVSYIIITYIVCWTPFHIVFDCQLAGLEVDKNWYTFAVLMCYLNSTVNPLLYALGNPKLKAAFKDTLACGLCKKKCQQHR